MDMPSANKPPKDAWRIIDANLNRIGEGLRLLEDAARLLLDDAAITEQLKAMRHRLVTGDLPFNKRLLQGRDAEGDIGVDIEAADQKEPRELPLMVVANSRRVQESLRVIEELAKAPGLDAGLDTEVFKQARFELYSIERRLFARLLRRDKARRISGLYAIIDSDSLGGRSHAELAAEVIRGGARVIQLRDKSSPGKKLLAIARQVKKICAESDVLFIMNDHLDLALAADADGLHLGQDDLPIAEARRLLPIDKILGCSTHTPEQATAAAGDGADYIAAGSVFPTATKEAIHVIGLEGLRRICQAADLPVVAIGGITAENAAEVIAAGAVSATVISALSQADSPEKAAQRIAAELETAK